jgi:hypothetical protein
MSMFDILLLDKDIYKEKMGANHVHVHRDAADLTLVYVKGLTIEMGVSEVDHMFSRFGKIRYIDVYPAKENGLRIEATVAYIDAGAAQRADAWYNIYAYE